MKTLNVLLGCVATLALAACTNKEIHTIYPDYDDDRFIENPLPISSDNPYFTATDEGGELLFKTKGGEVVITVSCPTQWAAEMSDGTKADDWLGVYANCELGTLTVTATQNTAYEQKTAVIELVTTASGLVFATITVTQNACGTPEITVAENNWNVPAVGALTTEIGIETSFDEWTVETSCTWLLVEKLENAVRFTADPNEDTEIRTTEVTLTSGNGTDSDSDTIVVTQDGRAYITLSSSTLSFYDTAEANLSSATVESNYDWDFSYNEENGWFTISRDGDTLVATVLSENETDDDREGEVTISAGDGMENTAVSTLRVTQLGIQGGSLILAYTVEAGNTIQLPISGDVDCTVDWGDSSSDTVTSANPTHTYENGGEYLVIIKGTVTALSSQSVSSSYRKLLTGIIQWGLTGLTSLDYAFYYCVGLDSVPGDTSGAFSEVTTAKYMFSYAGDGSPTKGPASASGLAYVSEDLFQYADKCTTFERVFDRCYNLQEIPEGLFRNCTSATSFKYAFYSCINIQTLPENLFGNCPELTDMTYTFSYCTSLTNIPSDLFTKCTKVTSVANCFEKCWALKKIPDGVFDNLAECTDFSNLFAECSALDKIPENLFANNLIAKSFEQTFYKCSSIVEIPENLFAGMTACTSVSGCFNNCSGLTSIPKNLLKDMTACTTVASLFYACSSISEIPEGLLDNLPACTTFSSLFRNTAIATIPADIFKNCSAATTIQYLFSQCENIESVPEGLFDGFVNVATMTYIFQSCPSLKTIPGNLFSKNTEVTTFANAFNGCSALQDIPEGLFSENTKVTTFASTFYNCSSVASIPVGLFDNNPSVTTFNSTFNGCSSLTSIPEGLFDKNTKVTNFGNTFNGCTSLTGESPYTEVDGVKVHLYERADHTSDFSKPSTTSGCFKGCTGLSDYDDIPSGWL